eukprot:SAG22_NODE_68_length_22846_cov_32.458258_10_plen_137_part_00
MSSTRWPAPAVSNGGLLLTKWAGNLLNHQVVGLDAATLKPKLVPSLLDALDTAGAEAAGGGGEGAGDDDEADYDSEDYDSEDDEDGSERPWEDRTVTPVDKKAHKKLIKEQNREKRKDKTPKKVKKRKKTVAKKKK